MSVVKQSQDSGWFKDQQLMNSRGLSVCLNADKRSFKI